MRETARALAEVANLSAEREVSPTGEVPFAPLVPLPAPEGEASEMPCELLPGAFSDYAQDVAERTGGPIEYVAASLLCAAGAAVGRRVALYPKRHDDWREHSNLWALCVGPPATLKSPLMADGMRPLRTIELARRTEWERDNLPGLEQEKARLEIRLAALTGRQHGRRAALEDGDAGRPREIAETRRELREVEDAIRFGPARFTTSDTTPEALAELLRANSNGILTVRDEVSGWLADLEREGRQGARAFYLEGWAGRGNFDVDRIGRGAIHVPHVCLGVAGTIQPGPLADYVRAAAGGAGADGLLQRFQIMVWPQPRPFLYLDRAPDVRAADEVAALFEGLTSETLPQRLNAKEISPGALGLRLDSDAQEFFESWYQDAMQRARIEPCAPFAAYLAKVAKLFAGLALIFHAAEVVRGRATAGPVTITAARRAAACCGFFSEHAAKVFGALRLPELAAAHALVAKIRAGAVEDGEPNRDLYRRQWRLLSTPEAVAGAIEKLAEHGFLAVERIASGGRPSNILKINPAAFGDASK